MKRITIYKPVKDSNQFDVDIYDPMDDVKREVDEFKEELDRDYMLFDAKKDAAIEKENYFMTSIRPKLIADLNNGIREISEGEIHLDTRPILIDRVYFEFDYDWWLDGNDPCDVIAKEKAFFNKYKVPFLRPLTKNEKNEDYLEEKRAKYVASDILPYHPPMRKCNYNPTGVPFTYSDSPYAVYKTHVGPYHCEPDLEKYSPDEHVHSDNIVADIIKDMEYTNTVIAKEEEKKFHKYMGLTILIYFFIPIIAIWLLLAMGACING